MKLPIVTALLAWAGKLRFKQLFVLTATVFVLDIFIPDMVPFADEALLGLATLLLGSWKDKRATNEEALAHDGAVDAEFSVDKDKPA